MTKVDAEQCARALNYVATGFKCYSVLTSHPSWAGRRGGAADLTTA
jgi:hypothetical protein